MDVGCRGWLYALHFELVAHLRFVDLDLGLTPAVGVTRARHLFLTRQRCLEGSAGRPPQGRPQSARALGRALPAASVFSSISLPPLVWGSSPHHTYTDLYAQRWIM